MFLGVTIAAAAAYLTVQVVRMRSGGSDTGADEPPPGARRVGRGLDAAYGAGADLVARIMPERVDRRERIREVLGRPADAPRPASEVQANRGIALATTTFAVASLGRVLYPPLLLLTAPGITYRVLANGRQAREAWVEDGAIKDSTVRVVLGGGMIASGHIWTLALFHLAYAFIDRILTLAYDESNAELSRVFGDLPATVFVERAAGETEIALSDVSLDDRVVVQAGAAVPVDGIVTQGVVIVDQHTLTGESAPVERRPGEPVFAGTMVVAGRATLKVERRGADTLVARTLALLQGTADFRTESQFFCERVVDRSIMPMLGVGAVTWGALGPTAGLAAITCGMGYQMRFTGPLCIRTYLREAADRGVLVKDGRALERAADVDIVVFDKTGTLTDPRLRVVGLHPLGAVARRDILRLAGSAERRQAHPIAEAIVRAAEADGVEVTRAEAIETVIGHGVRAMVGGTRVVLGSARLIGEAGLLDDLRSAFPTRPPGGTRVFIAVDGELAGCIDLAARPRPEAARVVADLRGRGLEVWILSGDSEAATAATALSLGVDGHIAQVLPQQKAEVIERLQADGKRVCFVGDGVNDAVALKVAHVSLSLRGATTAALDTAHVVLAEADLSRVSTFLDLSTAFGQAMQRNLVLSLLPAGISLAGIYTLGTGIITAAACSWAGLGLGAINASMRPRVGGDPAATPAGGEPTDAERGGLVLGVNG